MNTLPLPLTTKPATATTTCRPSTKEDTRTNDKLSRITSNKMNDDEGKMKTSSNKKWRKTLLIRHEYNGHFQNFVGYTNKSTGSQSKTLIFFCCTLTLFLFMCLQKVVEINSRKKKQKFNWVKWQFSQKGILQKLLPYFHCGFG